MNDSAKCFRLSTKGADADRRRSVPGQDTWVYDGSGGGKVYQDSECSENTRIFKYIAKRLVKHSELLLGNMLGD